MSEITTVLDPGMVVRYMQSNGVPVRGMITSILRHNLRPWLQVSRIKDGAAVIVGLHQVREVLHSMPVLPVVHVVDVPEVVESKEVPVTDFALPAPWVLEAPAMPRPAAARARIGETVSFLSPYGTRMVGVVHEIDESGALVETSMGDLFAIDPPDILAVSA